uniref:Concanavalin A-like lectin/glucanase superfamily protein n=1 Tax=Burkholderia phage vB_BgluM-SURPRISE13 TaxID=3159457 RepID=A0AAU7PFJ0_9VIRU
MELIVHESSLLLKKKVLAPSGSPEALWGAADMFPSNTSVALPLNVAPPGSSSGVSFVSNAPAPIPNAALFTSSNAQIALTNTPYQLHGYADFCVEWWMAVNGPSTIASLWHPGTASGCAWSTSMNMTGVGMSANASVNLATYSEDGLFAVGVWAHCAISRQSTATRIFVNGILKQTTTTSLDFFTGDLPFYLGYRNESVGLGGGGYLAGFRLTRGNARYTQSFTPSTVFQ